MTITVSRRSVLKTTRSARLRRRRYRFDGGAAQTQPVGRTDRPVFSRRLVRRTLAQAASRRANSRRARVGRRLVRVGADAGEGISRASAGPAGLRTLDGSRRLRVVVSESRGLYRERARQGGRRVRSYRRRENGRPDRDAVRRRFSRKDAVSLRRQRTGFGHLDYESIARSAERQTRVVRIRGDDRVLERDGEERAASGHAGLNAALSSFDLERDGVLQRIAAPSLIITADRSALQSVEKVRKYQMAIPRFAARRAAERRVSHRRRESRRVRRQRARLHSRARVERLAVQRRQFNALLAGAAGSRGARPPRRSRSATAERACERISMPTSAPGCCATGSRTTANPSSRSAIPSSLPKRFRKRANGAGILYVASSDEHTARSPRNHYLNAFEVDSSGALEPLGDAVRLRHRPIHITVDLGASMCFPPSTSRAASPCIA